MTNFHAVIGLPNNKWSDQALAFEDDLILARVTCHPSSGNQVTSSTEYRANNESRRPAHSPRVLARNPKMPLFGPFTNANAGTNVYASALCTLFLEDNLEPPVA
jgi:hypothetical protein